MIVDEEDGKKEAERGPRGEPDPQEELICTEFTAREVIEFQHETRNLKRYGLDCRSPLETTHGGRRDRSTGTSLSTLII
ncbi:unnamed protein product [Linum tenue]|uniref:Uncharacterized protein n=1 Tax=Linum tenue TaxID=586396 RepID=A0AAV0Q3A3_9ROSI|nr:unnamed protein product [Linum tenue]